jgi:hypothetical protein
MTTNESDDLQTSSASRADPLVAIVDDATHQCCVLAPADEYNSVQGGAALDGSDDLSPEDMIAIAVLTFSGSDAWDAPRMDDYDG